MEEESTTIEFNKEMNMEQLINAIKQNNDATIIAFTSIVQKQSELILGEIKKTNDKVDGHKTLSDQQFEMLRKQLTEGFAQLNQRFDNLEK